DGSNPTAASPTFSNPINVTATETIKAIAIAGGQSSSITSATYTITTSGPTAPAAPTFSPQGGVYVSAQLVTIADATQGAVIHFTTDGSTPTAASPVFSAPISVTSTETIEAIAIASGLSSGVASATYTIGSSTGTGGSGEGVNNPTGFPSDSGFTL